ncbi:hypothetical protein TGPRC2_366650, partial [Toxoplasma gondii TgCatPRC2]
VHPAAHDRRVLQQDGVLSRGLSTLSGLLNSHGLQLSLHPHQVAFSREETTQVGESDSLKTLLKACVRLIVGQARSLVAEAFLVSPRDKSLFAPVSLRDSRCKCSAFPYSCACMNLPENECLSKLMESMRLRGI